MKKFLAVISLVLASLLSSAQSRPAGIVFSAAASITFTYGPTFAQSLNIPSNSQGTLLVTYSNVSGANSGCSWTVYFGASNLGTAPTSWGSLSAVPATPSTGVTQTFHIEAPTNTTQGPYSTVALGFTCLTTFPLSGTAFVEFIPGPVVSLTANSYAHITTNTNTVFRTTPTTLHTIVINQAGTTETITVFDNTTCSGNVIAVASGFISGQTLIYDLGTNTGLCITTAGTTPGDYTVVGGQ